MAIQLWTRDGSGNRVINDVAEVSDLGGGGGNSFSAVQVSNTDTTTNINFAAYTKAPVMGSTENFGDGATDYTVAGDQITFNFTGLVRVSASIYLFSTAQRAAIDSTFRRNASGVGSVINSSYIRNANGHNEGSNSHPPFLLNVTNGDTLEMVTKRGANAGTVTLLGVETSKFLVERVFL